MEDTPQEMLPERHGTSRRDFIKRSAVTGAVVWSAPAISTLSSKAWAQTYPAPCVCTEGAFALSVDVNALDDTLDVSTVISPVGPAGPDETNFDELLGVNVGNGLVTASAARATTRECFAQAELLDASIDLSQIGVTGVGVITAEVLKATATGADCATNCEITNLAIGGDPVLLVDGKANISLLDGAVVIAVCEEITNGTASVNALRITVNLPDILTATIIVSHAETTCC